MEAKPRGHAGASAERWKRQVQQETPTIGRKLTDGQGDHGLLRIRSQFHRLDQIADRVEGAPSLIRRLHRPTLARLHLGIISENRLFRPDACHGSTAKANKTRSSIPGTFKLRQCNVGGSVLPSSRG